MYLESLEDKRIQNKKASQFSIQKKGKLSIGSTTEPLIDSYIYQTTQLNLIAKKSPNCLELFSNLAVWTGLGN